MHPARLPFTAGIIVSIVSYVWFVEGKVPRDVVIVPGTIVVLLTAWHNLLHGEWGFSRRALRPGLWPALAITCALGLIMVGVGAAIGTLHNRRDFLGSGPRDAIAPHHVENCPETVQFLGSSVVR
jgi:hypothetical protein